MSIAQGYAQGRAAKAQAQAAKTKTLQAGAGGKGKAGAAQADDLVLDAAAQAAAREAGAPSGWFGFLPLKTDRSRDGFIRAIRAAMEEKGGIDFDSAADMCDCLEEAIRRKLNGAAGSVSVRKVGSRRSNGEACFVIETSWKLREDVEHAIAFQLFKSTR